MGFYFFLKHKNPFILCIYFLTLFLNNINSESESEVAFVSDSLQPHGLTIAYQAPLSLGFSRQEYWSGLPFPSPGDLPDPGIEPRPSTL